MMYNQRDVVWTNFMLPSGESKPHMAIIVSCDELHEQTGVYYFVLISSKNYNPDYTFELSDDMFINLEFDKKSYAICHILSNSDKESGIFIKKCGRMRKADFDEMLDNIQYCIFG